MDLSRALFLSVFFLFSILVLAPTPRAQVTDASAVLNPLNTMKTSGHRLNVGKLSLRIQIQEHSAFRSLYSDADILVDHTIVGRAQLRYDKNMQALYGTVDHAYPFFKNAGVQIIVAHYMTFNRRIENGISVFTSLPVPAFGYQSQFNDQLVTQMGPGFDLFVAGKTKVQPAARVTLFIPLAKHKNIQTAPTFIP